MIIEELRTYDETAFLQLSVLIKALSEHRTLKAEDLEAVLQSPDSHLFVARDEEGIQGMCTVGIYASPTGRKACLEDVAVNPLIQGRGTGRMLVQHALDYLKEHQVSQLLLTSRPSRVAANALYRSMGFRQKETNVYIYEDLL
ncbi:MAG: GNAT family N-acetyltransferase [Paraprevotella sp.]|nr:GNAT family N-acetyltransferase [Paraprevotella sp.]